MGVIVRIEEVPDVVFSEKMVGDGVAIEPLSNGIYSPIDGVVKFVAQQKHSFTITHNLGFDIVVHIGLETVSLKGDGFNVFIKVDEHVKAGQLIGEFDLDYISLKAKSLITPIIFPDLNLLKFKLSLLNKELSELGQPLLHLHIISDGVDKSLVSSDNLIKSNGVVINNRNGIHVRPASKLADFARKHNEVIFIEKNNIKVNLQSISSILKLAIAYKDILFIYAKNNNIIKDLENLINSFEEEQYVVSDQVINKLDNNKIFYGVVCSKGIVKGTLVKKDNIKFNFKQNCYDTLIEVESFQNAIRETTNILNDLISRQDSTNNYIDILDAQISILNDPIIISDTIELIKKDHSAAFAYQQIIYKNCEDFANTHNKIILERQADLKEVCYLVLKELDAVTLENLKFSTPTILFSEEITTNDIINLDDNVLGLISVHGGMTSHASILARLKGIPLLINVNSNVFNIDYSDIVILDCNEGYINLSPSKIELEYVDQYLIDTVKKADKYSENYLAPAKTIDERELKIFVNISSYNEAKMLNSDCIDGIGLLRTEFLYNERKSFPTIDEQSEVYKGISKYNKDKIYNLRLLDLGGDKHYDYLSKQHEVNPALGVRGIRYTLIHNNLLYDQIYSIVKANIENLQIMIPMVTFIEDYDEVKFILNKVQEEFNSKQNIKLGIMVEVPATAMIIDRFAEKVDFLSIGTNDLTQYLLAIDRENNQLAHKFTHLHPSVIKVINDIVISAKKYNKPLSICGLMACDKYGVIILVGLGLINLSVPSNNVHEIKSFIRKLNFADCVDAVNVCLNLESANEVKNYLQSKFDNVLKG